MSRPLIRNAACFVLFFLTAAGLQWAGGAYQSEFGGHPDEAAHYVTGLMVHDFIATPGAWKHPKAFADDYYKHYPKIGLGVWPPFFYLVQSAWTLVFTPARASVLLLMAALAAALATVLFSVLRESFKTGTALVGAVTLPALPLFVQYNAMIMAETLSALLIFSATVLFGKYLDDGKPRNAIGFGICATVAILTKGTGLALALMAPLAILFAGKFSVLKNRWLWIAAAIVAVLAGPWTWATRNLGKGGWEQPSPSLDFTQRALVYYARKMFLSATPLITVLALIGVCFAFRSRERRGLWSSFVALILAIWIFQSIAPVGLEARHLIPMLPAIIAFAVAGVVSILRKVKPTEVGQPVSSAIGELSIIIITAVALAASSAFSYVLSGLPKKHFSGFGPVAQKLLADPANRDAVFLVSSDATGEGMFISEVAMHDSPRPGHVAQRASKAFTPDLGKAANWNGSKYQPRFASDSEMLEFLLKSDIRILVVDDAVPERNRVMHEDQLRRVIDANPQDFTLVCSEPLIRNVEQKTPVRAYKIVR